MPKLQANGLFTTGLQQLEQELVAARRPPVVTATALWILAAVPETAAIQQKLAQDLQKVLTKRWLLTWDLLSVFQALAALQHYDRRMVSGEHLAHALQRLVACEVAPGGPYASAPGVIEPAANAAIARFLLQQEVVLPQLQAYLDGLVAESNYASPVVTPEYLAMLLAEVVSAGCRHQLRDQLTRATTARFMQKTGLQELSVRVSLLYQLGARTKRRDSVTALRQHVAALPADEPWPAECFYEEMLQSQPDNFLSTALLLRALSQPVAHLPGPRPGRVTAEFDSTYAAIKTTVDQHIRRLPTELQMVGSQTWQRLAEADPKHEIALLPTLVATCLRDCKADDKLLQRLGAANCLSWLATIIYDDFIDEEGQPALLPFANVAQRRSLALYMTDMKADQRQYIETAYDMVDQANAWEVAHTRAAIVGDTIKFAQLPDYGDRLVLAERAFGHVLGVMLAVQQLPQLQSSQLQHVVRAMQQFLIARQLNDDLHDWRQDLQAGQLSAVVSDLLHDAKVKPGTYRLAAVIPRLEEYFMQAGLVKVCQQIGAHVEACFEQLEASGLMAADYREQPFAQLVANLKASADEAMVIQATEQAFLQTYGV